jgi:hypothetical protein
MVTTEFARNALGGTPSMTWASARPGAPAPLIQNADDVAAAIEALIVEPRAEIYTQDGQLETVLRYYKDVSAFESNL